MPMARIRLVSCDDDPTTVVVTLSERNLLALLTKLYTPCSAAAIIAGDVPPGMQAVVNAESDEAHYGAESREEVAPGAMLPLSESIVREVREAVQRIMAGLDSQN